MMIPNPPPKHPAWLRQTKRLFPHPLFAGTISLACFTVGTLLAGVAINVQGAWLIGIPATLFFVGSFATASAAFTSWEKEPTIASDYLRTYKPTFAIFVLLIGTYSWILTIVMHVFNIFFKNGPGSFKYYVTLGIAISSSVFMRLYGTRVVREHFAESGTRRFELTGWQAFYITLFVVTCGIYAAWLVV